ncbi:MAG: DUF192 domain-containing protein [Betaproteobacteria bacterium]
MKPTTPEAVFAPAGSPEGQWHRLPPTRLAEQARRCLDLALRVLLALGALGSLGAAHAQDSAQQLPAITLTAGMHRISAEVARTPEQRAIGLMHRKAMPQHAGMIFVFERPEPLCFWMKNTLIPLSIAFLQDDGTILNIEEMKPQTLNSHCSARPARFALEMNAGWFSKRGLKPGDKVSGEIFK